MSMIKCSECGKEISDKAKVCIHCGNPLENVEQDNSIREKKVKEKKTNKTNKILAIILILLINLILFAGGTFQFLNSTTVTAEVIYPIKTSGIVRFKTENTYECNIVYEYKGIEYHDTLNFNDDNLPKEIKNSSKDPNYFDVKLKGYVNKNNPDYFNLDMKYYNICKYIFYIQAVLVIPSVGLIIINIISLIKNRNKSEKGINKVALVSIIALTAIIIGGAIFYINKNKNLLNNKDNTSVDWGLNINGTSIILPCSLDELTKAGIKINEEFYEELMSTTNKTFSGSYATSDNWAEGIYLDLKTGSDLSKREKNVTITSIDYKLPAHSFNTTIGILPDKSSLLTSSQFSIKNNITIGSKSEDIISAFGTDYEPKSETDLNGLFSLIFYKKGNDTLTIGFENGFVREIKITTTNSKVNKKESYNSDNTEQNNTSSNNTVTNTDDIDREELISSLKFNCERGYFPIAYEEYEELETYSDTKLKEMFNKYNESVKIQGEYDSKYANQLNEIFRKEINIELKSSEDENYIYMPSNKTQPKAQIEYVAINENGISTIYYSVEMNLNITNKKQNNEQEITTKKYYKVTNINELDGIIKIDNYNTQANQDEINNATTERPFVTYHLSGLPYYFYNAGKYVLYYLPDENRELLYENEDML